MLEPEGEDRHQILASSSLSLSGARVLKHGDTFAVFDRMGDIRPFGVLGAQGVYHEGCRFVSSFRLRVGGERPLLLSSTVREDNLLFAVDLMCPDLVENGRIVVPHGTLHILRMKILWEGSCYEHLSISNFGSAVVDVELTIDFSADFVDVFQVRGTPRESAGDLGAAECLNDGIRLVYEGKDGVTRRCRLRAAPKPSRVGVDGIAHRMHIEPKQTKDLYLTITCEASKQEREAPPTFEAACRDAAESLRALREDDADIYTSNSQFNDWVNRSLADLRMMITKTEQGPFPYAGVPWFSTPFGRDALITAMEMLWINPSTAKGVLTYLAHTQASEQDASRDAEPGKILHELRMGEMAALGEVPFGRYYGSVDSTPLFVMLAAAYYEATGDRETLETLWPNVERALAWIDRYGDADGDGFVEYGRRSRDGLANQGWKDSYDAVFHADGGAVQGPVALAEVQGYVYAARLGAARLSAALGLEDVSERERARAETLKTRFDRAFWCDDLGTYALALDHEKRPCRVRTSNAAQCLFSGIAYPHRAAIIAEHLLDERTFSGWGIRTVSVGESRYNPLSYHNGSIWPHDNALIAAGLARYGFKREAATILGGLFDASLFVELRRLPELFCGFPRRPGEGPTLYPVACAPQAWASAAPLLLLQAILGMTIDGVNGRISFERAILPEFLPEVRLRNLKVGTESVDLELYRHPEDVGIRVARRTGSVTVATVK